MGESKVKNWKSNFAKTRGGFGHTEVSLPFVCTVLCILSYGRGPRGQGLEGLRKPWICVSLLGDKNAPKNTWKCIMYMVRFSSLELSTHTK
jgi:hypothetical protein